MPSPLVDLDELILECRDRKAKAYLAEAVGSYRAGAFRASIVATWIAVCFDLIDKLRELALAGDKEAEKQVEELEKTRQANDLSRALKFERELLDLARDKFELISHLEYVDLARLRDDRNRCAHPSLISDEQAYAPSAELSRTHIHAAVSHLLRHPPVQGKYALQRLHLEVDSDYFPTNAKDAATALKSGPLGKPRASLVRNFVVLMLKRLLLEGMDGRPERRVSAALNAVAAMHPTQYDSIMRDKLTTMFRGVDDESLSRSTMLLRRVEDSWQYLEEDQRLRLNAYVSQLPVEEFSSLDFLLGFPPLRATAVARIAYASWEDLYPAVVSLLTLPASLVDRVIALLGRAKSFAVANNIASELAVHASDFSIDQIEMLVEAAGKNRQVRDCVELPDLFDSCRRNPRLAAGHFDAILARHGLEDFIIDDDTA